ncbi:MAG TPA: VWA domain-containing protein, partial [Bacillota bacterium]|nr:VWA domain-containing protein [Bacillota bacterium]
MENSRSESTQKENTLELHLVKFFQVLRHMGVRVSAAEAIDALTALLYTNLTDRDMVKTAMRTTLCKDRDSIRIFDQAFDSYFVPGDDRELRQRIFKEQKEQLEAQLVQAENELVFAGGEEDGSELWEIRVDLSEEQKDTYTKLPEEEKAKIREFLATHKEGNQVNDPYDMMASVVRGQLNFWQRKLAEEAERAGSKRTRPVQTGDDELDEVLEHIAENITPEDSLLHEDMRDISEKELPQVSQVIRKLTKKLATRISRRYRQSRKRQKVDLRRTIRHNIRYGGALLKLEYKTKKVERPKLLLICDVSASMSRYATFVLQFTYGLASVAQRIESFVFSDSIEHVSHYFSGQGNFEATMARLMEHSQVWGKGTNLGESLGQLWQHYPKVFTGDTVAVIVSDAKTVALELADHYLAKMQGRVKDIIWLNTLPRKEWNSVKQVTKLRRHCRMY